MTSLLWETLLKGVRSFLGHVGFYWRLIKDFSKIENLLDKMLEKEVKFHFDEACTVSFKFLKEKFVSTRIIISADYLEYFEVMCDVSSTTLGVLLGKVQQVFHPNYYAIKTLNSGQCNYTFTEQELLAVV